MSTIQVLTKKQASDFNIIKYNQIDRYLYGLWLHGKLQEFLETGKKIMRENKLSCSFQIC